MLILSIWRSGSFHSNSFLRTFSMLRHSKRCFTQVKPASLASLRSRSASSRWPHRKTWTAGEVGATRLSWTRLTVGAATFGSGVGEATVFAAGFVPQTPASRGGRRQTYTPPRVVRYKQ